jgi:hypothetical protein
MHQTVNKAVRKNGCVTFLVFSALLTLSPLAVQAADSTTPATCPTQINTSKNFIWNFNNSCYAIPLITGNGSSQAGDPNALYDEIYYQVNKGYQLIVYGIYPNARFLSATVYDSHLAETSSLIDANILPLNSTTINPLLPGATFVPSQWYGIEVSFGGGQPVSVSPGCSLSGSNVTQNIMQAYQIHQGLSWNGWLGPPPLPEGFPAHQTGANTAGVFMIRKYLDIDNPPIAEVAIVRSLTNGCAITAAQAKQLNILSTTQTLTSPWLNQTQINDHQEFTTGIQPSWCFPADPLNQLAWQRSTDYIALNDNYAGYMNAPLSASQISGLLQGQNYLRLRFQMPTTPNTPCSTGNCSLTGLEQIRYWSLDFEGPENNIAGTTTLHSVADTQLVQDSQGNVTMIIGFGAPQPPYATAANKYTWVDLSGVANLSTITGLRIRNLLQNVNFGCSTLNIPYQTSEYNPLGGYIGNYVPTADFPTLSQIPQTPTPVSRANTCALIPIQLPLSCAYTDALSRLPIGPALP